MKEDPHEILERALPYAKKSTDEQFFSELNRQLAQISLPGNTEVDTEALPFIFIVGVPRSGTTLTSQVVSRFLPVSYMNNLIARFWARPSVGIRLSRAVLGDDCGKYINLESTHGTTSGVEGPHEFGYFWRHWLLLDEAPTHHLSAEHLAKIDKAGLKNALENEIIAPSGRCVVFKNVICGFHASFLTELHKKSLFIHVRRDLYASAASILDARQKRYGSYSAWWSLKPSTWPFKPEPTDPVEDVARQVIDCDAEFRAELSRPGVNSMVINYTDLCTKTCEVLDAVCQKLGLLGYEIKRNNVEIPRLKMSNGPELPPDMKKRLETFF